MRKGKVSGEVAVMEVSGALLGVRTRSRTLALQRTDGGKGEEEPAGTGDYLELRSRRLVKPPPPPTKDKEASAARWAAAAAAARRKEATAAEGFEAAADLEASFGDNVLDWDAAVERSTRETTPCSLIKSSDTISTPGSATRTSHPMSSRRRMESPVCRYIPSSLEMDEFFAAAEQQQHQIFRDKYNFCPANDCPLSGRYEWARLDC